MSKKPSSQPVFVALAGGGAKGLIHVGALRALEDRDVEFCGLAGTSAGAIVATLKAAGFSSRDLFDPDTGSSLIDQLNAIDPEISRATDIFGRAGWSRVWLFRWAIAHAWLMGTVAALLCLGTPLALIWAGSTRSLLVIGIAVFSLCSVSVAGLLGTYFVLGGLADVRRFRTALAKLLQRQMFPRESKRTVTMGDFARNGRPTLKIVSANLSRRQLHLFSPERTPDIAVADAVAASICLPLIFTPWRIGASAFVDGGIVSNLPAWPFDEERELDPRALTVAVEIADTSSAPIVRRFNWLPSAIRTALFGSGELNLRAFGQTEHLTLESSLNLLQFDMTLEQARQEVLDGEAAASVQFDKRLFRRPELYRNACEVTRGLAEDIMESALEIEAKQVRVAIAVPDRDYYHSLRLSFASGYDADVDEGMLIPTSGSVIGAAWKSLESQFELAPFPANLELPGDANRRRRKLFWPELEWQLCIPIFDAKHARFVVHIGGNAVLPRSNPLLEEAITKIENSVKEFFNLIIKELSELEDNHGVAEHNL